MKPKIFITTICIFFFFNGYTQNSNPSKSEKDIIKFSKNYIKILQSKNYEKISNLLNPESKAEILQTRLKRIVDLFPSDSAKSIEIVELTTETTTGNNFIANITFQYEFTSSWLLINLTLQKTEDKKFIVNNIDVRRMIGSLKNVLRNGFKFKNKLD